MSLGSEDPNESLPQRVEHSQFAWTADKSGDRPVVRQVNLLFPDYWTQLPIENFPIH